MSEAKEYKKTYIDEWNDDFLSKLIYNTFEKKINCYKNIAQYIIKQINNSKNNSDISQLINETINNNGHFKEN